MQQFQHLASWHSNWRETRFAVIGLGSSGFSAADTLAELGSEVKVFAESADQQLLDILEVIGVQHEIGPGATSPELVLNFEPQIAIISPGVSPSNPLVLALEARQVTLWTDIDLAWRLRDKTPLIAQWFVITGTNGKTTTSQLLETMLNTDGRRTIACGNIGFPILDAVRDPLGFDALVVELSSFQLHYLGQIQPYASAFLNIAEDHLDWHGGFEQYLAAKSKIFQNTEVACVYNAADPATEHALEQAEVVEGARAIGFTLGIPALSQVGFVEDILCDRAFLEDRRNNALEIANLQDIEGIGLITPHLLENIAAATALARSANVEPAIIREALRLFRTDAHRIELVEDRDEVRWVDDSKATNAHAAAASIAAFENVVWILGGLLKGVELRPLVAKFKANLIGCVVIGSEQQAVLEALASEAPEVPVRVVEASLKGQEVMDCAVEFAGELAAAPATVLLAPAAASMDQFRDYAERGECFAKAVRSRLGAEG